MTVDVPARSLQEIATTWFDALRRREMAVLLGQTQYPFELRDTGTAGTPGRCSPIQRSENAREARATLECLVEDEVVIRVLGAKSDAKVESLHAISSWPRSWRDELATKLTPFGAYLRTPDAMFNFVIFVGTSGVRAVWKTGFDVTTEVRLATEWLAALRDRELNTLERLTSYPFELRDTQERAYCGARTAATLKELPGTVACLMADSTLGDALRMGFRLRAAVKQDFEPGFFEGWRRPEQTRFWPVMTLLADGAGNEYDLTFLVDQSGVHVMWKRGSFVPID